ncbi:tRNA epoxyqueuosine(34) reductase QueG [candidate division KSB1 bacterium]|nr:tRNA epoxyqueuosine(34) reductase QueG [candidate division KSB1 bacterium]
MFAAGLKDDLQALATAHGCDLFGVAPAAFFEELNHYPAWLEAGYAGEMAYLHRQLPGRMDVRSLLPEAKSVIVIGVVYHTPLPLSTAVREPGRGWISRYAWGDDYHDLLRRKLTALHEYLTARLGEGYQGRYYTDTGPVLDRVFAKYAGLGWFGKNTNLINQKNGSWFFIGELITNLVLECDAPPPDRCGTCRRCLDACPTDAFPAPYVLDSNRCISYLTIELRGAIPEELRQPMGSHVFGCDICQDVCPWNRKAPVTNEAAFAPRANAVAPQLAELAAMDEAAFRERFKNSPIKRSKWRGLMRNVLVALGNSGRAEHKNVVARFLNHSDFVLAEAAQWAYRRLQEAEMPNANANAGS